MSDYRRGQAFLAGSNAANRGKPRSANNRQPGTIYFDDWCDGYDDAARRLSSTVPTNGGDHG